LENVPDPEKEIDIGVSEVSQLFTFGAGSIRPRRTIVPIGSEVIPAQNSKAAGYTQLRSTTQIVAASQPAANEV